MDWVSSVGWSATGFWVPEIVFCGSAGLGAGSWFIVLGVLDFVNGGADTVLWYCSVLFLCISAACFFGGIAISMPNAPISVLAWAAGGYQELISGLWFRSHCHCKMWHQLRDSQLRFTITFDHG